MTVKQKPKHAFARSRSNVRLERTYSGLMLKILGKDIIRAEGLVSGEIPSSGIDDGYVISLDPEDFLDLCSGKWLAVGESELSDKVRLNFKEK